MNLLLLLSSTFLLPAPVSVEQTDATYEITNPAVSITVNDSTNRARLITALESSIDRQLTTTDANAPIRLKLAPHAGIPAEGYKLVINNDGIDLTGADEAGLYYGIQTLGEIADNATDGKLPHMSISDYPRLPYRGLMLDVSRHFRDKEFVKKQIDAMAKLKLNTLHLHLTDAAGWRLEIDRYPRLTEFAAWRPAETWKQWNAGGNLYCEATDPAARGGYYTKEDIRELVKYAADRYITIIPEIEMPSHSEEVLTAYPEYSCTHVPYKQSDFCPGNDSVYTFLENVLTEVMELFPSKLIHIGGDEAPKQSWPDCPLCQKRMKEEGLENVDQLQSYLIHRIERFLNSKGRDMLGWDEIMEGGLAPNATVMSWRGTEGGEKAAAAGHRVIMTPGRYCYLDGYQDAPYSQPEAIGGYLPLELAYSYDPVPESLRGTDREKFIYGLQGNLFTEYVPTAEHAEYMLYPRMYAIAERAWSPEQQRDYADFHSRAMLFNDKMKKDGYNVFDLSKEIGNREEAKQPDHHLAYGKPVEYRIAAWKNYPANGNLTLTDGLHGGWNYNDQRWQGFVSSGTKRMDVVIDLGKRTDIKHIGADFMQICGPGVWMPANVVISVSNDGKKFRTLATIPNEVRHTDEVEFKNFSWNGSDKARYIRYQATADPEFGGILFTDEIVVR